VGVCHAANDGRPFFFAGLCGRAAPLDADDMLTYAMVTKAAGQPPPEASPEAAPFTAV
jgi:putative SOS response-associated peptidase YedK